MITHCGFNIVKVINRIRPRMKPDIQSSMCFGRKEGRKEENVLFKDALDTFYLWFYDVGDTVKDHSESERKSTAATWATLSN